MRDVRSLVPRDLYYQVVLAMAAHLLRGTLTMAVLTVIVRDALSLIPWERAARKTGERRPRRTEWQGKQLRITACTGEVRAGEGADESERVSASARVAGGAQAGGWG